MDEPNLDQGGASEDAATLELEPETKTPEGGEVAEPNDPLDDIKDPKARDEAKKARAIARRQAKEPKAEGTVVPDASKDYLTKADFQKANERKAVKEVTQDPDVKANWNKIIPFYTPRRGRETPEDIVEDINDAITLYKARNPDAAAEDTSAADLTVTPVVKSGSSPSDKTTPKPKDPPNFSLPRKPADWYPKKK